MKIFIDTGNHKFKLISKANKGSLTCQLITRKKSKLQFVLG